MLFMCCMSFGQFLKLLFVIILTTLFSGFCRKNYPSFSLCHFGSWPTYLLNFKVEVLAEILR